MKLIAGIPEDVLEAHNAQVREMKVKAYELALNIARMTEEERKYTGYKDAGQVLIDEAKRIEKLTVALERKYPA